MCAYWQINKYSYHYKLAYALLTRWMDVLLRPRTIDVYTSSSVFIDP